MVLVLKSYQLTSRRLYMLALTVWVLLSILTTSITARAQYQYSVNHYSTQNGLPQNSVIGVAVDRFGFAWIATKNGLVRFDGRDFRIFNLNNSPQLLGSDRLRLIANDDSGRVFFNNASYEVYRTVGYNAIQSSNIINQQEQLLTINAGLINRSVFEQEYARLVSQTPQQEDIYKRALPKELVYKLNEREVYVQCSDSSFYIQKNGIAKVLVKQARTQQFILNDTLFAASNNGFKAFFKAQNLLQEFSLTGDIVHDISFKKQFASQLKTFETGSNTVFNLGNNFYSIERQGNSFYTRLLFANLELPNLISVKYDSLHNHYYFGTNSDGFYLVKRSSFRNVWQSPEGKGEFINAYNLQILLPNNEILANNNTIFDTTGKAMPVQRDFCISGTTDNGGSYWYASSNTLYKTNNRLQQQLVIPYTDYTNINYFTQDTASKQLWCASQHAIYRINEQQAALEKLPLPQFNQQIISHLSLHDANHLWVGTDDGLYLVQLAPLKVQQVKNSAGKTVRNLKQENNDLAWVATYGQGAFYLQNMQLFPLPPDKNGNLLTPHFFIEDKAGFMWIPTNKGLFQVLKQDMLNFASHRSKTIYYHYYCHRNGFASNEFNGGTSAPYVLRKDGVLSIPTMNGLIWFTPEKVKANPPDRTIYFDKILADGKQPEQEDSTYLFPHYYNLVEIALTVPYYGNRENLNLEYQIKGLSDAWVPVPDNHIIMLSRLTNGSYEMLIRNAAGFGGKYVQTSFAFRVQPAWFQSSWFFLLLGLLGICIIMLVVRLRTRQLVARKRQLVAQIARRTASLKETLENYKQINTQLENAQQQLLEGDKTKEQMIAIILHDLWSPLSFIADSATSMAKQTEHSTEEVNNYLFALSSSSNNILSLTEQLLKWMRSQQGSFKVEKKEVNICELLNSIAHLYKQIAAQRGNTILINCPTDAVVYSDPSILKLIVRNMVDNANKNTKNGHIILSVPDYELQKANAIYINDNGRGMSAEKLQEIRQLSQQQLQASSLGYRFAFGFARLINAILQIESEQGKGTTVIIQLPADNVIK